MAAASMWLDVLADIDAGVLPGRAAWAHLVEPEQAPSGAADALTRSLPLPPWPGATLDGPAALRAIELAAVAETLAYARLGAYQAGWRMLDPQLDGEAAWSSRHRDEGAQLRAHAFRTAVAAGGLAQHLRASAASPPTVVLELVPALQAMVAADADALAASVDKRRYGSETAGPLRRLARAEAESGSSVLARAEAESGGSVLARAEAEGAGGGGAL